VAAASLSSASSAARTGFNYETKQPRLLRSAPELLEEYDMKSEMPPTRQG
jgi:hypothetical protein